MHFGVSELMDDYSVQWGGYIFGIYITFHHPNQYLLNISSFCGLESLKIYQKEVQWMRFYPIEGHITNVTFDTCS